MATVTFEFDIPPTTNKLYQRLANGAQALKKEARKYEEHVKQRVADQNFKLVGFPIDRETLYCLHVILEMPDIENEGWYQQDRHGERKAETRYKRKDTDNRIKFLKDAFSRAIGIPDDSQVFCDIMMKRYGTVEKAIVSIWTIDDVQSILGPRRTP